MIRGPAAGRIGYDELRRRKEETAGQPKACIEYLENVLKNRAAGRGDRGQPDFVSGMALAKKKYGMLLMLITHAPTAHAAQMRDDLLRDQQFAKFVNANITFVKIDWPADTDTTPAATAFKTSRQRRRLRRCSFNW